MAIFATEFPIVDSVDRGRFVAQVIAWVRGIEVSTLFEDSSDLDQMQGEATIKSATGEILTLRECAFDGGFSIGARHEIPDPEGRLWRSEVILKRSENTSTLRSRTQCIISNAYASIQTPRKPYFITLAIDDGWPSSDGEFALSHQKIDLKITDIKLASDVILGNFQSNLPVVYVSKAGVTERGLDEQALKKLAFRLGGIAHVLVEPSREFSRRLQVAVAGNNPYGGAVGISVSNIGVVRRFLIGNELKNLGELAQSIFEFCVTYVSNRRPLLGWDWSDLIEASNREAIQNSIRSSNSDFDTWNELRNEENAEKDHQIDVLRRQLEALQSQSLQESAKIQSFALSSSLVDRLGRQLYDFEFSDRLLRVLKDIESGRVNLDPRTKKMISNIVSLVRFSGGASKLADRIKVAGRDSSNADARLGEILKELGFQSRHQGGHPVFSPVDIYGISAQTLSTSASDHRAGRNAAAQIVRDWGLDKLAD